MKRLRRKSAVEVQEGDYLRGPRVFSDVGEVQSTVVVDNGVQINYVGGSMVVRPEDYLFDVAEKV